MTSSPPEELSSFFISAAACLSPGQQPAARGEGTSARLSVRDVLAPKPSVSPSDWSLHITAAPSLIFCRERPDRICAVVCSIRGRDTDGADTGWPYSIAPSTFQQDSGCNQT